MSADYLRPWCCRHRWTLTYVAVVVTIEFIIMLYQLHGGG